MQAVTVKLFMSIANIKAKNSWRIGASIIINQYLCTLVC